jgi:hypothetical protein
LVAMRSLFMYIPVGHAFSVKISFFGAVRLKA